MLGQTKEMASQLIQGFFIISRRSGFISQQLAGCYIYPLDSKLPHSVCSFHCPPHSIDKPSVGYQTS